ncbi:MAG: preprotein translocase subunit SecA, partial [Chloroflexi bacterium]|nr:preprotein translocase subunit SecA [Chloroflexota bacterium]
GQQDPLVTYKREAFDMFDQLVATLRREVSASVMHATVRIEQGGEPTMPRRRARGITPATREAPVRVSNVRESGGSAGDSSGGVAVAARPTSAPSGQKVGRNAPCPCGSGKKYKRCHGKAA